MKNLYHHQELLQHSNEPSTGVFISPVAEDQETPTIRIISKHETVIATMDKYKIVCLLKGKAFHAGALVLALAKIQDIFKKYSG